MLTAKARVRLGDGRNEGAGVGVTRCLEDPLGGPDLDDLAEVHDGDPVGQVADQVEVVGDDQIGEPKPILQRLHKVEDRGRGGDVEPGGGLVRDEELRVESQGAGDADPSRLAAGELVRVFPQVLGREPDEIEELGGE